MDLIKTFFLSILVISLLTACGGSDSTEQKAVSTTDSKTVEKNKMENESISKETNNRDDTEIIPSDASGVNYAYIAKQYCKCAEQTFETLQKLDEAKKVGNKKVIEEIVPNYNKMHEDVVKCCIEKKKDHTKTKLEKPKLADALNKECPDMPSSMLIQIIMKTIF